MPNPYIDGIQNGGTTIDIYDAALRNTIGQANGLASLDANGKLPSTQLPSDTTTSASGNPISIPNLKSNQLAINPMVTFNSAISTVTLKVANGSDPTAQDYAVITDISEPLGESASGTWNVRTGIFTKSDTTTIQLAPHEVMLATGNNYVSSNGTSVSFNYHNGELASLSDVAQLGETVNELGNEVTDVRTYIKSNYRQIGLSSGQTITIPAQVGMLMFVARSGYAKGLCTYVANALVEIVSLSGASISVSNDNVNITNTAGVAIQIIVIYTANVIT